VSDPIQSYLKFFRIESDVIQDLVAFY